jgi:ankyrin repeat protein
MLLEAGGDIHRTSSNGITPYQEAKNNTNNDLELLLEKYQDENKARQREADKAKHEALKERAEKAKLKREQAEIKAKEEADMKAQKAADKTVSNLEKLYEADGKDYLRPLLKAMQSKDSFAVKLFTEKTADINAIDDFYNTTPLMMAIQMQNDKLAKYFIESGADPINFIKVLKHSALTKAVSLNRYELVEYIIDKYRETIRGILNFENQALTPQFIAYKDPKMLDILIGAGANPHFGGKGIPSPLVKAIQKASIAILPVLARHKVDLNQRTDGKTPLEWAIYYNRMDWVNGLIAEGAKPELKNSEGQNALEFAKALGDRETIVAVLEEELG